MALSKLIPSVMLADLIHSSESERRRGENPMRDGVNSETAIAVKRRRTISDRENSFSYKESEEFSYNEVYVPQFPQAYEYYKELKVKFENRDYTFIPYEANGVKPNKLNIENIYEMFKNKNDYFDIENQTTKIGPFLLHECDFTTYLWYGINNYQPTWGEAQELESPILRILYQSFWEHPSFTKAVCIRGHNFFWSSIGESKIAHYVKEKDYFAEDSNRKERFCDNIEWISLITAAIEYCLNPYFSKVTLQSHYNLQEWMDNTKDNVAISITGTSACGKTSLVDDKGLKVNMWGSLSNKDVDINKAIEYQMRALALTLRGSGRLQDRSFGDNYLWRFIQACLDETLSVPQLVEILSKIDPSIIECYKNLPTIFVIDTNVENHRYRMERRGLNGDYRRACLPGYCTAQNIVYLLMALASKSPVFDINQSSIEEVNDEIRKIVSEKQNRFSNKDSNIVPGGEWFFKNIEYGVKYESVPSNMDYSYASAADVLK